MVLKKIIIKNKYNFLFFIILALTFYLYNYHHILFSRPYSMHQWRQSDCLSITMNYYKEDLNFFEPSIHWVANKDGKTVSECPLIYYSVAKLWKVFGYHEFIFRLVNLLIVTLGLFCLFKLIQEIISDAFWSLGITFLLFSSPILAYYSNNFLADAPALSLALTGSYLYWHGFTKKRKILYFLSFLFFLLGGLIKISSLIAFFSILAVHLYCSIFTKKEKGWFYKWNSFIPYFIVGVALTAWYTYAFEYKHKNINDIFLLGLYPIWELDWISIKEIWSTFRNDLLPAYFNIKAFFVILVLFIISFINYKKVNKTLFYVTILVFVAFISYIILFYQAFNVHDYYLTNLLIFIPLPLITTIEMVKRHYPGLYKNRTVRILFILSLALLIYETSVITRMKYSTDDWLVKHNFIIDKKTFELWNWYHYDYSVHYKALDNITPYLRSIGINREDRVLALPDVSFNVFLYLMDQKGFSSYDYSGAKPDCRIPLYKKIGLKYIIGDTAFIDNQEYLKPYLNHIIGKYKNIGVYKID